MTLDYDDLAAVRGVTEETRRNWRAGRHKPRAEHRAKMPYYRHGTVAAAAREAGCTKSAVSQAVRLHGWRWWADIVADDMRADGCAVDIAGTGPDARVRGEIGDVYTTARLDGGDVVRSTVRVVCGQEVVRDGGPVGAPVRAGGGR